MIFYHVLVKVKLLNLSLLLESVCQGIFSTLIKLFLHFFSITFPINVGVILSLLQADPTKLISTLAVHIHTPSILLHNFATIGARLCIQRDPAFISNIFLARPRLPDLELFTVNRLVARCATAEAEHIEARGACCVEDFDLHVGFEFGDHFAVFAGAPIGIL